MEEKITFDLLCRYAKAKGYTARTEPNAAKNYSKYCFGMYNQIYMALYQVERIVFSGHDKPEVAWVCIDYNGTLRCLASRQIRTSKAIREFGLSDKAKQDILNYMGITRKRKELNKLLQEA